MKKLCKKQLSLFLALSLVTLSLASYAVQSDDIECQGIEHGIGVFSTRMEVKNIFKMFTAERINKGDPLFSIPTFAIYDEDERYIFDLTYEEEAVFQDRVIWKAGENYIELPVNIKQNIPETITCVHVQK